MVVTLRESATDGVIPSACANRQLRGSNAAATVAPATWLATPSPQAPVSHVIDDPKQRGILVVDDERGPRESLRLLLKSRAYANVHVAEGGSEALTRMNALGPAIYLVLTDLRMPRIDGMALVRRLAAGHPHPVGVVAITGYPSPENVEAFRRLGTERVLTLDLLAKPYDVWQLLEGVGRWLGVVHERRARSGPTGQNA